MEFFNRVLVIISVVFLFFTILVKPSEPFLSKDELKEVFGPVLDEAKESLGPVSDKAKDAFGPISSSILDEAKEAIGPITPSTLEETLDDAKESLGPISPSAVDETFDDAKDALGPSSSDVLDKAKEQFESWISLNKEEEEEEEQKEDETLLDEAKQKFDSVMSFITQNKHSSLMEEAEKEFGPIESIDIDPTQPPTLDDEEEESNESFSVLDDENKNKSGPISSFDLQEASSPSTLGEEVKEKVAITSQTKEEISSEVGPVSSSDEDAPSPGPGPSPSPASPSTFDDAKKAIGSISSKALDAAKDKFGSLSSLFSQNKVAVETTSPSSVYFDHDVALAIESLIQQGKSKSQLAIDEAKKLINDGTVISSSDKGNCIKTCMENYASSIRHFDKATEDLKGRNSEFLINDVSAVDGEISACQSCFSENQSPLKDLEEAIVKAARECLNVLDHSG